jgi:hypothetical protein
MKPIHYIIFTALFVLHFSCKKEDISSDADKIVVEAFLYEGEKVEKIRLKSMIAYGGKDTLAKPINDAEIDIIWKNKRYRLQNSPGDSGYYHYPNSDLQIISGEIYYFECEYNGRKLSAVTQCPTSPQQAKLSKDTFAITFVSILDSLLLGGSLEIPPPDSVIANWANPNKEYFYIVAENIETDKLSIFPPFIEELQGSFYLFTRPTQENTYSFFDFEFRHLGKHTITIYKVNQEYVELFSEFSQDSRTQAEPITNIYNGLGIFTAVSSAKLQLFVKLK